MIRKMLSVVVPAYKQEKTIEKDLKRIEEVLEQTRFDFEIICVVDGILDNTYKQASKIKSSKIKVYYYQDNRGKGYAIKYGTAKSKGDPVVFIDAGMEINPNGISMLLEHMEWYEADIIVGSKRHPASQVVYPFNRRLISFFYQQFVKIFGRLSISDTQAGLKVFRRKVLCDVLPRLVVKRYAFDLELLLVANRLGYKRIFEAPIKLDYNFFDSTHAVSFSEIFKPNGLWYSFVDTLAIIYRLNILHYYDDKNKKGWIYDKNLQMKINVP